MKGREKAAVLLIALGPNSVLMTPFQAFGIRTLAFTFTGLVIGSLIYSLCGMGIDVVIERLFPDSE